MGVLKQKAEFYDSRTMNTKSQEPENIQVMISKKSGGKQPSHNDQWFLGQLIQESAKYCRRSSLRSSFCCNTSVHRDFPVTLHCKQNIEDFMLCLLWGYDLATSFLIKQIWFSYKTEK